MAFTGSDRRQARRVEANLRVQVQLARPDGTEQKAALETINISTTGVYFRSDHFIEPMTRLAMALELGVPAADGSGTPEVAIVNCEGLVVRSEPEREQPAPVSYEVAVFFTALDPAGAEALERHIALLLQSP